MNLEIHLLAMRQLDADKFSRIWSTELPRNLVF